MEEHGVGIWIKKQDDVISILNNLFSDSQKLKDMKEATKKLTKKLKKPDSTKSICEILNLV